MKVLLGLYEPDQGRMLVDNIDVKERSIAWRHRNIGVVFQDFSRFQFSARRNVGIGWVDDDDESRIWEALEKADADATVRNLSSGLDTALGPSFGGHDISGGQWQRVALARLFMHQGRLWLLDEPSAAMDPETEERTFRRFREWTARRTSVIVTHRLSTVLMADRIAVLEGGRVVETGTHAELVALNGRYTRLFPSALRTLEGTQDVVTAAPLPPN
jgi:ATP-binding cassette subfamily B protein